MKNTFLDRIIRALRTRQVLSKIAPDSIVCDLGCDEGYFLKEIKGRISRGYGFDRRIKNHAEGNLSFMKVDLEKKIPRINADYVTMLAVIEHLGAPEKVIKAAYKILRKGGRLILTTPSPRAKLVLDALAKFHLIDSREIAEHKHYFSRREIINLLSACGFRNIRAKSFEFGLNSIVVAEK